MEQTERLYLATTEEKDGKVLFALQELDYFLPLVGVAKAESKQDATAVLSLGFTNEAKEQGFTESDVEDLKDDGFTIKTVGNTYFVLAKTEYGIVYGVYAFLENLCVYATKTARVRNAAVCKDVDECRRGIEDCVYEAIGAKDKITVPTLSFPLKATIIYNRTDFCDDAIVKTFYSLERTGARSATKTLNDVKYVYEFFF